MKWQGLYLNSFRDLSRVARNSTVMIPMRMIDFNRKVNRHGSVLLALGVPFVIPEIVAIVCAVALVQLGAPIA